LSVLRDQKTCLKLWRVRHQSRQSSINTANRAAFLESEKGAIVVRDAEIPKPGQGEVLVKVRLDVRIVLLGLARKAYTSRCKRVASSRQIQKSPNKL
jgi:hypothetical protein